MAQRIRQSVAAGQQDLAATLAEARRLIRRLEALVQDIHDGVDVELNVGGRDLPVRLRLKPREAEKGRLHAG